jgi:hypothetical protein
MNETNTDSQGGSMNNRWQWIPVAGLLATMGVAVYMVVQLSAQDASAQPGDFRNAASAEVRDAQGQVVLRGQFAAAPEDDDDIERKAPLEPAGADTDATGDAEVEYDSATATEQEVEFSIRNVDPGAQYSFVIDGVVVGSATANARGRAELDVDVKLPGAR